MDRRKTMKSFSKWSTEEVEEEFQLVFQPESQAFQDWLQVSNEISSEEASFLHQLSRKLRYSVRDWNEEELKIYFIALLLDKIDFYQEQYRPFMERELSVEYGENKKLWGFIDFLVAQGKHSPKQSFFFIHEYKKELDSSNDPLGQLLAEMVAAQKLNQHQHPIYGAYIIGRHWYFVILEASSYTESLAYDATKEDIINIFCILRQTKALIEQLIIHSKPTSTV
ncbi:hypothetical protein THIOM_002533 [Candidatus Thiomargarita nelsonii]|uniref:Uncharacterized protein n=1 Tax=Candidatus Thiomargarita nelsonii TaxID=1003181 RepID=A0A176S153_9GAMM|nr:hypothetical protein THIOM_002533 [Candidatus Thiomargarita nelsonii]